jgi:Lar family restriction alleviation protein
MNKTLLPCPFCGGKARWMYRKPIGWVMCKKCGASSVALSDYYEEADCQQEAIAAWNRRANLGSCENELIVRCENCKHYNRTGCSKGFGWCERMDRGTNDDFYCSLAERSEG